MAKFIYRDRGDESREKRVNQSGGAFDHYIKDEYRLFTPVKGENCVRILPPSSHWKDAPHYGLDVFVHFGVGPDKGSVICLDKGAPQLPGMSGKPCPICQERMRAERARDDEMVRELRSVKRVITAVLDRKDEGKGVLIWGMPFTCDRDITKASRNRQLGGWYLIDRPDDGYDMYFFREGEGQFTKYNGFERAQNSSTVADRYIEWVEQNPVPEMLKWRDYDEVKRIFEGLGRGEDPDEVERPVRRRDEDERPPRQARDERPPRGDREREEREERNERRARDQRPPRDPTPPWRDEPRDAAPPARDEQRFRDRDPERAQEDRDEESLRQDAAHLDRVTREPVRRPTAAAGNGNGGGGNGQDREPAPRPSTQGSSRAEQLRQRFLNREGQR